MSFLRSVTAVAALFLSSIALHASPSDALAVIQQCGRPLSDVIRSGSAEYSGAQRVLQYRSANLHFQRSGEGWNFSFANPARSTQMRDRAQTGQMLPCFSRAMNNVQLYVPIATSAQTGAQGASTAKHTHGRNLMQIFMDHLTGVNPVILIALALLYVLPSIIALIRRPIGMERVIIIDLLMGWTVLGWGYALLLANEDRADHVDEDEIAEDGTVAGAPVGMHLLNTLQTEGPVFIPSRRSAQAAQPVAAAAKEVEPVAETARPLSFISSAKAEPVAPVLSIRWTDHYNPPRHCRINVVSTAKEVTVYDMDICERGADPLGREVIGGYVGKTFMVFPMEKVLQIRDLAA